jgi:peptidyl-tRNA hydrolase, PTH1 family
MRLFVGLGNHGPEYERNRHNLGFLAVKEIARRHGFPPWRRKFQGVFTKHTLGRHDVVLLFPLTLMNDSGRAVREAADFFDLTEGQITVFHDELELPPAKVRVKVGGGIAGHNGLRSVTEHIGNDYRRVRLGIGHPGVKHLVHRYVLSNFPKNEWPWVVALCETISRNVELLANDFDSEFQNRVHLMMQAQGFFSDESGGEKQR